MSENTIELNNKDTEKKVKKEKKKKKRKEKKKRKSLFTYLKETRYELKQVSWSTKKETLKNTWIVILTVLVSVLICYGFDSFISFGLKLFIK